MNKEIIKKFNKKFFDIEIGDSIFRLDKNNAFLKINSFYYYSEFQNLEKFKILKTPIKKISMGLSIFVKNEKKIGICFFGLQKNKFKEFLIESVRKENSNLKIQYYSINKINQKNPLHINCFFYDTDQEKGAVDVKIFLN